ncbi:phage recombination protein Bet [Halalkalibacter oceani]|uniref:phage recombination protein Bet n=1 Tax=Halalkalibacter oceani TaxID=1653776 RepID=UPI0033992858
MSEEQSSSMPAEQGSGSLATTGGGALLHFSPEKIKVIKNTVAKGATDDELEMFLHLAERYQLDPFAKEIWFVKRPKKEKDSKGNWDYKRLPNGEIDYEGVDPVIMTSRDGYVKVAQSDAEFEGLNSFEVRANDTFHFNPMTGDIKHEIGSKRGSITGAWAICKRKGREPAIAVVDFDEYKKAAGKNPVWDSYPSAMIRKVAEVIVLKRQFNISGLVTQEEMPAQYNMEYDDPNIKRLYPKHTHKQTAIDVDDEWKRLSAEVKELRDELGLEKEQMESIALFELGIDSDPKKWSLSDIQKMVDYLKNKAAQYESKSVDIEEGTSRS